jgi:hypothetical protein
MRYLFIAYCMAASQGQVQIGAYKRGLRVALELESRGHEVSFFCTGRHNYHDPVTDLAERKLHFVEFPFLPAIGEGARHNRLSFLRELRALSPDAVLISDAPMAGTLLETTLCAVELEIPTVCLDNAYEASLVDAFCWRHGSLFDGMILSGPSALHGPSSYPALIQVPPFIEPALPEAQAFVRDTLGLTGQRLIVVLAYDQKVQRLGLSLLERLDRPEVEVLFVGPADEALNARLAEMPAALSSRARVIATPEDGLLFGLFQLARCAVTKCGYMQVTECLSLHTPVVGVYYPGYYSFEHLPRALRQFTHAAIQPEADESTLAAARRFLEMDPDELNAVHTGRWGAAASAASFVENLPRSPRAGTQAETARLGWTASRLSAALRRLEPGGQPEILFVRSAILRTFPDHELYIVVCVYRVGQERRCARLWCRLFRSSLAALAEARRAQQPASNRRLLHVAPLSRRVIELDMGEESLASIKELAHFQN